MKCKDCEWWRGLIELWNGDDKPPFIPKNQRYCERFPRTVERIGNKRACGEFKPKEPKE